MRFRPEDDPRNTPDLANVTVDSSEPFTPVEWEDNWLSNAMAWVSYFALSDWCQTPEHFSSRLTRYLFTDCPCCLLWRGLALGYLVGGVVGFLVASLVMGLLLL